VIVIGVSTPAGAEHVDAAAADLDLRPDGTLHLRPLGHTAYPWTDHLRRRVRAARPPAPIDLGAVCELDTLVGQELGAAARHAVDDLAGGDAGLIASHGLTMHHWVVAGRTRGTLQLGNAAWIAERVHRPVVSDFRVADVAAGGQGAPLSSVLDALWLGCPPGIVGRPTAALGLGAVAHLSVVGTVDEPVLGWDTGPGTCLLDLVPDLVPDLDGAPVAPGRVDGAVLAALLAETQDGSTGPASVGSGLFDHTSLAARVTEHGRVLDGPDLVATLAELTAVTVARSLAAHGPAGGVERVVLSGAGARDRRIVDRLRAHLPADTTLTVSDELGIPAEAKEAYLFALLGFLSAHGLPGTAPGPHRRRATGARRPAVLGSLTPPAPLPVTVPRTPVRRLVLATAPGALVTSR
jgi:anhydro-N-acetylmuramic acid kinase